MPGRPFVAATLFLVAGVAGALAWPSFARAPVGVIPARGLPIALRGATHDPALSERLAELAEASLHDGEPDELFWAHCVTGVAVLTVPVPVAGPESWREDTVRRWAAANGWEWGPTKDLTDVLRPPAASLDAHFEVMPLAADARRADLEAFERVLVEENPDTLLVLLKQGTCPDPHPRWKQALESALLAIGAR